MYFSIGWEAELIIFVKWFKSTATKGAVEVQSTTVVLTITTIYYCAGISGVHFYRKVSYQVNFTHPGICTSHITCQYFNVLIERLSFHPACNFVLSKNAMDVYSTPQGACFRNVFDGIALRTPSLLCYIFICYCVIICATLYVFSMYLIEKLCFFCT